MAYYIVSCKVVYAVKARQAAAQRTGMPNREGKAQRHRRMQTHQMDVLCPSASFSLLTESAYRNCTLVKGAGEIPLKLWQDVMVRSLRQASRDFPPRRRNEFQREWETDSVSYSSKGDRWAKAREIRVEKQTLIDAPRTKLFHMCNTPILATYWPRPCAHPPIPPWPTRVLGHPPKSPQTLSAHSRPANRAHTHPLSHHNIIRLALCNVEEGRAKVAPTDRSNKTHKLSHLLSHFPNHCLFSRVCLPRLRMFVPHRIGIDRRGAPRTQQIPQRCSIAGSTTLLRNSAGQLGRNPDRCRRVSKKKKKKNSTTTTTGQLPLSVPASLFFFSSLLCASSADH